MSIMPYTFQNSNIGSSPELKLDTNELNNVLTASKT